MGAEHPPIPSPAAGALAGTAIAYEVSRQVRLACGVVELGRFRWPDPVEQWLRHEDDVFAFNLALSPRPPQARISAPGSWLADDGAADGGSADDGLAHDRLENIGRVLLLLPGTRFRLHVPTGHVRTLYCGIDRACIEELAGGPIDVAACGTDIRARLNVQVVELLLNRIYEELRDGRFASEIAIDAHARALCVELARAVRADDHEPAEPHKGGLAPWRMRLLEQRIHAEAPAPHLSELAALCGMTVRQLSRAFKEQTGKTLGRFIDEVIVERALRLLLESEATIAEIAATLGFSTAASFAYSFRRATGVAPSEFRRRGARSGHASAPIARHSRS